MDQQAMLTRDLVLRICATATEFDSDWIGLDRKVVAPFTAPRDTSLIERITAAAAAMGVEHVLICRTRPEHAYEPVTQVRAATPSLIGVIRGWGDEPTDFLVCLEDFSAAVLVTADELTVAAGPADYVAALVGADIGRARAEFAGTARDRRDPELLEAAAHYGCLDRDDRSGQPSRPRRDLAERLTDRAGAVRDRTPRLAAGTRALRGAWGWAMVLVLVPASLFVPGLPGTLAVAALTVWLLAQLAWLARSRTLSFAALLRLTALGALTTWPVALAELGVAAALRLDPTDPLAYAYLAVPVEEIAKFTPLLLLWLAARHRVRRFTAVDHLLAAAACGAGFQLVEAVTPLLVFGEMPAHLLPQGGPFTLLPGWLEIPGSGIRFSGHAVTTGLVGAAVGLAVVGRGLYGAKLWLLPPLALGAAALEHLNHNALLAGLEPTALTTVVFTLYGNGTATRWLLLALLVCAVLLDHRMFRFAAQSTPPPPGTAPLRGLVARAHGRAVWRRCHLPGDIAPLFRGVALAWARFPVTLTQAASAILHEFAVQLAAASRGPATLCAAWRFLRRRREHAAGAARAAQRPRRRGPERAALAAEAHDQAGRLGLAAAATLAAAAAAGVATAPFGAVEGEPGGAYAAVTVTVLTDWFTALPATAAAWTLVGTLALASLLVSGWAVPRDQPSPRHFLRTPSAALGAVLGTAAPGQLPYLAVGLLGLLLPKSTDRLLTRSG